MSVSISFLRATARLVVAAALCAGTPWAAAQRDAARFPRATIRFLDAELPAMDRAVAAGDRAFFHDALGRMVAFADGWGFKVRANPELAGWPMCTDAVQDYLVVGLCRITPHGEDCTPQLASGFERNLRGCREAAGR